MWKAGKNRLLKTTKCFVGFEEVKSFQVHLECEKMVKIDSWEPQNVVFSFKELKIIWIFLECEKLVNIDFWKLQNVLYALKM